MQIATNLGAAGLAAAVPIFIAFLLYNRQDSKINTGTWVILAVGDSLDAWSYFLMTGEELLKNVVPLCFAAGSIITFVIAIVRGRFSWPRAPDWFIVFIDLGITALWHEHVLVPDATVANLAYQGTTLLAFVPMCRALMTREETETVAPWALWTMGYVAFFMTYALSGARWEEGVYPVVGLVTHGLILGFALQYRLDMRRLLKF